MNSDELVALRDAINEVLAWPPAVRAEIARWLAPPAAKPGNGLDLHPPLVAATSVEVPKRNISSPPRQSPTPYAGKARRAKPSPAKAAEQRLLAAMADNPGLSVNGLANAAGSSRSAAGERLRQLARAGTVEKDAAGRWRLKAEEMEARPTEAFPLI